MLSRRKCVYRRSSAFFLSGIGRILAPGTTMPHSLFVIFQMTFAIITPALVVGAFAERMKFGAMCLFSLLWFTAVTYLHVI